MNSKGELLLYWSAIGNQTPAVVDASGEAVEKASSLISGVCVCWGIKSFLREGGFNP